MGDSRIIRNQLAGGSHGQIASGAVGMVWQSNLFPHVGVICVQFSLLGVEWIGCY